MRILLGTLILFICFCFIGCDKQNTAIDRIKKELLIPSTDTLIRRIPAIYADSSLPWDLNMKRKRSLGLPSIEWGKEGFHVRIWEDYDNNSGIVFILNYLNKKWSSEGLSYKAYSTDGFWPDSLVGNDLALTDPISGWDKFLNQLLNKNLLTLRDYNDIPGYFLATDMVGFSVEIAATNYYRFYSLPNAKHQTTKISDAANILKVGELLRKEFPQLSKR